MAASDPVAEFARIPVPAAVLGILANSTTVRGMAPQNRRELPACYAMVHRGWKRSRPKRFARSWAATSTHGRRFRRLSIARSTAAFCNCAPRKTCICMPGGPTSSAINATDLEASAAGPTRTPIGRPSEDSPRRHPEPKEADVSSRRADDRRPRLPAHRAPGTRPPRVWRARFRRAGGSSRSPRILAGCPSTAAPPRRPAAVRSHDAAAPARSSIFTRRFAPPWRRPWSGSRT